MISPDLHFRYVLAFMCSNVFNFDWDRAIKTHRLSYRESTVNKVSGLFFTFVDSRQQRILYFSGSMHACRNIHETRSQSWFRSNGLLLLGLVPHLSSKLFASFFMRGIAGACNTCPVVYCTTKWCYEMFSECPSNKGRFLIRYSYDTTWALQILYDVFSVSISLQLPLKLPDVCLMKNSPFSKADFISAERSSISSIYTGIHLE